MKKKCLWCLKTAPEVYFKKKAHSIPKSLGGQNFNPNVCDSCNEYFGNRIELNYSIEEALKEGFNITRKRILTSNTNPKKKVGRFKSKFFEVKEKNGKYKLTIKPSFRFNAQFQRNLCNSFKRGLYKIYLEELDRQEGIGLENKFNSVRQYARYNIGNLPVVYFNRKFGILMLTESEAETPFLMFNRMKYLYKNDLFDEIEFLGHVFGLPFKNVNEAEFRTYINESFKIKKEFFKSGVIINKLTDIDFTLQIMNN